MSAYILEMSNIMKKFPGVVALNNVNMRIKKGEIHALCGENGAGKSTLIKILSAVYPYGTYSGDIKIDGEEQNFSTIKDAEGHGVVCIQQELALLPDMSINDNVLLANEPNKFGVINWNEAYEKTRNLLKRVSLPVGPATLIGQLGVGQQQLVEIAKALSKDARLLVLDEPTSALTDKEVDVLMGILEKLRQEGVTCIYISHKLDEVFRIADSVTVLRDGEVVMVSDIKDVDKETLIQNMVGRKMEKQFPRMEHKRGDVVFEVKDYTVAKKGRKIVDDISFKAHKGEILGIGGLMGAGRTELMESLFGAHEWYRTGEIYLDGKKIKIKNPTDAIKHGVCLLTEDRKAYGLNLIMSVKENISLANLGKISHRGVLNDKTETIEVNKYRESLNIKTPNIYVEANTLSGGNQQKVVIGKWLMADPKVLILDEPTRGIDVGSKYEIYNIINNLVEQGIAVIMISSELEEIIGMCSRVLVMREGRITGEVIIDEDATQEKIMKYAMGENANEKS